MSKDLLRKIADTEIVKHTNLPFRVIGKRIQNGLFRSKFIISCYVTELKQSFRMKVDEPDYYMLKVGNHYKLKNIPVFQDIDKKGKPVGDTYIMPSNLLFG